MYYLTINDQIATKLMIWGKAKKAMKALMKDYANADIKIVRA